MRRRPILFLACAIAVAPILSPVLARAQDVTVMAAASLTDAFRQLGQGWVAKGHTMPHFSFASSSTLARQIAQGAPADIFASADEPWMDYLQKDNLILKETRTDPIGNRLVLIAPKDANEEIDLKPGVDLVSRLGPNGRIATGDPSNVPVGKYAQAALIHLGVWDQVSPRLARAENVRAALLLVEHGEAPLGIVYATDAAASKAVRIVATFPEDTHPPIAYPFALTVKGNRPEARALFAYLTGPEAAVVYRKLGFTVHP